MAIASIGGVSAPYRSPFEVKISPGGQSEFDKILEEFKKVASETPASRARDAVLKKHGLTEDSYKTLRGPAREAVDKEIEQAVRLAMKAQGNTRQTILDI